MGNPVRRPVTMPVRGCGTGVCFFRIAVRGDTGCVTTGSVLPVVTVYAALLLPVADEGEDDEPPLWLVAAIFSRQGSHVASLLKFRQPQIEHVTFGAAAPPVLADEDSRCWLLLALLLLALGS